MFCFNGDRWWWWSGHPFFSFEMHGTHYVDQSKWVNGNDNVTMNSNDFFFFYYLRLVSGVQCPLKAFCVVCIPDASQTNRTIIHPYGDDDGALRGRCFFCIRQQNQLEMYLFLCSWNWVRRSPSVIHNNSIHCVSASVTSTAPIPLLCVCNAGQPLFTFVCFTSNVIHIVSLPLILLHGHHHESHDQIECTKLVQTIKQRKYWCSILRWVMKSDDVRGLPSTTNAHDVLECQFKCTAVVFYACCKCWQINTWRRKDRSIFPSL